ncbi:MAG: 3-methylornithine--L-lysine ligase PylC [Desulfovermiculus sp.]|nr:3-methylornithine--L-lysine ligase PylC [Desulfovermiculus sp.]
MNVAIIGGKLQGLEACYLARKAGWNTILIDKQRNIPAYYLCDSFLQFDIHRWKDLVHDLWDIDIIIPALENWSTLNVIQEMSDQRGIPYLFDHRAYSLSSSKRRSYDLLADIGIPIPKKWPECGFPLIIKPDGQSGSKGVQIHTEHSPELSIALQGHNPIAEQYISGPLYSLEVIGVPDAYETIQGTDLVMDQVFDCKRVIAPSILDKRIIATFEDQAKAIAQAVHLHGVMDVEAIVHDGQLITIEIDARLPSQTPTAVYWSCDCNILEHAVYALLRGHAPIRNATHEKYVIYEHIVIEDRYLSFCGEHCIAQSTELALIDDFMGADEAITNVHLDPANWVATLIFVGTSRDELYKKRSRFYTQVVEAFALDAFKEEDVYC